MRFSFLSIALLLHTLTPAPASASTIDDFHLTGEGHVISFSLPSLPAATPSVGAGGVVAGFFVTGGAPLIVDGSAGTASLEFLSGQIFVGPGLSIQSSLGNFTVVGQLLYSGTAANPTFNTGTFNLRDFYGASLPYSLTITPESAAAPEPEGLILLSTGIAALAGLSHRKLRACAIR